MKKIKIRERKLGREKAVGLSITHDNLIEIDPRQRPRTRLDTVIHEYLHLAFPDLSERQIVLKSRALTTILWKDKWRRVY